MQIAAVAAGSAVFHPLHSLGIEIRAQYSSPTLDAVQVTSA